ncbi:MAG: DUF952 domain-containing protein [Candidatus Muiribacteriota bacterium]
MLFVLHIAQRKKWEKAKKDGVYKPETLKKEGFIHLSDPQQIKKAAQENSKNKDELELLIINPEKLKNQVKYEDNGRGELFPHLYGPLNVDAVIKAVDFNPDEEGEINLRKELE